MITREHLSKSTSSGRSIALGSDSADIPGDLGKVVTMRAQLTPTCTCTTVAGSRGRGSKMALKLASENVNSLGGMLPDPPSDPCFFEARVAVPPPPNLKSCMTPCLCIP